MNIFEDTIRCSGRAKSYPSEALPTPRASSVTQDALGRLTVGLNKTSWLCFDVQRRRAGRRAVDECYSQVFWGEHPVHRFPFILEPDFQAVTYTGKASSCIARVCTSS